MYSTIPVDTSSPYTKKLLPYVEDEQLYFKAIPFSPTLPYAIEDKLEIIKHISLRSILAYPDKLMTLKSYLTANFINPIGSTAPDFSLETTTKQMFNLSSVHGRYAVFMFVCLSCPAARIQTEQWDLLYEKYNRHDTEFFLIYSRERHPGPPGYNTVKHPKNYAEKYRNAQRHAELTDIPVLVDTFDQQVLSLYGKVPNQAFIVNRGGNIAFKAGWANAAQIESVLNAMLTYDLKQRQPF